MSEDRYRDDRTERSDRDDPYDREPPRREVARHGPRLPEFLAKRLLRSGEEVNSVRGPRWSPAFEVFLTHPAGVAVGFALGLAVFVLGGLAVGWDGKLMLVPGSLGLILAVGGLIVVGIFAGYFTRLVITSERVMIVQGIEVRKTWKLDDLPRSLVHHRRNADGELSKTVDMEKLTKMMGGASSDGFVDAKSIWALSKEIDRTRREDRREEPREERRDERGDPRQERWGDRHQGWNERRPSDG